MLPNRRFIKTYEKILLSPWFSLLLGWAVVVGVPLLLVAGVTPSVGLTAGQKQALYINTFAFLFTFFGLRLFFRSYPGGQSTGLLITHVFISYASISFIALFLRFELSRLLLISSTFIALAWFYFDHCIHTYYKRNKLAVINKGFATQLLGLKQIDARPLQQLSLDGVRYDGVVADFKELNPEEERFLTNCALQGIPVYHAKHIYESVTGRVRIDYMSENNIGALLPSPSLERLKSLLDFFFVIITAPLVVPVCLLIALGVRVESPGPAIYTQTRIGKGGQPFTMYKFRSMHVEQSTTTRFAAKADARVTRVGRIIRKFRLDELPQFINILKGEMSLIGPRPEQLSFVEAFNQKIPFYSYRHVIKPGITGWAQVHSGYAADIDQTQVKIEHDFFYIKHYSLLLDLFIILLTVRTVITGSGAR